jgi:prepilin-type N-terminal cleavage/methylation domain-containing protein
MKLKRGFTLIELLIVIVIMGILAAIVVGLVATNSKARANDARKKADMREIQTALEQSFVDADVYPASLAALVPTYLASVPVSPVTTDAYTYTPGTPPTTYTLTVNLGNKNDKGPGVTNGVYTLTQKQ